MLQSCCNLIRSVWCVDALTEVIEVERTENYSMRHLNDWSRTSGDWANLDAQEQKQLEVIIIIPSMTPRTLISRG